MVLNKSNNPTFFNSVREEMLDLTRSMHFSHLVQDTHLKSNSEILLVPTDYYHDHPANYQRTRTEQSLRN